MKKLGLQIAVSAIAAGMALSAQADGHKHAQGGTLTVPIITQTFVDDFNPYSCLLYTSPSPRDGLLSRMPSSA